MCVGDWNIHFSKDQEGMAKHVFLNKLASRLCYPYLGLFQQADSQTLLKFALVMPRFSSSLDFVQAK